MPLPKKQGDTEELKEYLRKRIDLSRCANDEMWHRWENSAEALLSEAPRDRDRPTLDMNGDEIDPPFKKVVYPYAHTVQQTITTYLIQIFFGQSPVFGVSFTKPEEAETAPQMEKFLEYCARHDQLSVKMRRLFDEAFLHGHAVLRNRWTIENALRTANIQAGTLPQNLRKRNKVTVYEGPKTENFSVFDSLLDPRVSPSRCNRDGEWAFFQSIQSKAWLKEQIDLGNFAPIDFAKLYTGPGISEVLYTLQQITHSSPFHEVEQSTIVDESVLVEQGTARIIPERFGLSSMQAEVDTSDGATDRGNETTEADLQNRTLTQEQVQNYDYSGEVELWDFVIINREYLVYCERFTHDHGMHPMVAFEPIPSPYSYGSASPLDYIKNIQTFASFLLNSRMESVAKTLQNRLVYNPHIVDEQFLINPPNPVAPIPMKDAPIGADARTAVFPLPVNDATAGHLQDFQSIMTILDNVSGTDENIRGLVNPGGRKTATEIRTASEASASRLAEMARLCSVQVFQNLAKMWSIDAQQFLSPEFEQMVLGINPSTGAANTFRYPGSFAGDFNWRVHDGVLPPDKLGRLEAFSQVLNILMNSPLGQLYDIPRLFADTMKQAGIPEIEIYRLQQPQQPLQDPSQQGQQGLQPSGGEQTQGTPSGAPTNAGGGVGI